MADNRKVGSAFDDFIENYKKAIKYCYLTLKVSNPNDKVLMDCMKMSRETYYGYKTILNNNRDGSALVDIKLFTEACEIASKQKKMEVIDPALKLRRTEVIMIRDLDDENRVLFKKYLSLLREYPSLDPFQAAAYLEITTEQFRGKLDIWKTHVDLDEMIENQRNKREIYVPQEKFAALKIEHLIPNAKERQFYRNYVNYLKANNFTTMESVANEGKAIELGMSSKARANKSIDCWKNDSKISEILMAEILPLVEVTHTVVSTGPSNPTIIPQTDQTNTVPPQRKVEDQEQETAANKKSVDELLANFLFTTKPGGIATPMVAKNDGKPAPQTVQTSTLPLKRKAEDQEQETAANKKSVTELVAAFLHTKPGGIGKPMVAKDDGKPAPKYVRKP